MKGIRELTKTPPPLTLADFDIGDGDLETSIYDLRSLQVAVLLAGCRRTESSWGTVEGGEFTRELFKKLKEPLVPFKTYSELLEEVKVSDM